MKPFSVSDAEGSSDSNAKKEKRKEEKLRPEHFFRFFMVIGFH